MSNHLIQKEEYSNVDHTRFTFLESMVIWQGGVDAAQLSLNFEITKKLAEHVITKYKNLWPSNLNYVAMSNSFIASDYFESQYCLGTLQEYIQFNLLNGGSSIELLAAPSRKVAPEFVRPILQAIRTKQRLRISYASVSNPGFSSRIIQPHNLVFDGLRWHVRAYCEKNKSYRDFVLSRFNPDKSHEASLLGDAEYGAPEDTLWNEELVLEITPDPRLDQNRQRLIAMDYDMGLHEGIYIKYIPVRAALLMYLVKRLNLDQYHNNAQAQQIIMTAKCQQVLKEYLPD